MKVLFPPIKPYAQHTLDVDSPHKIYVEECGDPKGIPIVFVHGGPGAGCTLDDRRYFDPQYYRIVLFDQRGCGRSTPASFGNLDKNNTAALVSDMEAIRIFLGIDRWILFGGSWGATLSLVYAQQYPARVMGMILRGVFLNRKQDYQWLYQAGANLIFPDYWEEFIAPIPLEERNNLIKAYYKLLSGDDEVARMNAAKHWSQWEGQCATLIPCKAVLERFMNPHAAMNLALIETHYFMNTCFISDTQILRDAHKLENIPGIIVHGRYDMVCALENAYALHKAWNNSELHIVREAGHSALEAGIVDVLVNAAEIMVRDHR